MRLEGLRPMTETEMQETLTPHEVCRWKKSQAHAAMFAAQNCTQNDTVNCTHAQQVAMSNVIASGCPPDPLVNVSAPPYHCTLGRYPASCAWQAGMPLHRRNGLISVFPVLLSKHHPSHLLVALQNLKQTNRSLTFVGDSTAETAAAAAICTVVRFGSWELAAYAKKHVHFAPNKLLDALPLNRTLQRLRSGSCGLVVVSVGMHFNQENRALYKNKLMASLPLLDMFSRVRSCPALWRSTIIPHFPNVNDQRKRTNFSGSYQCTDSAASAQLTGAACWRESDVAAEMGRAKLRHLLVARLWRASAPLFDTHIGDHVKEGWFPKSDCLHDCPGPHLYEPLWWAVSQVVTATGEV